jgi:hypothetical protein
VKKRYQAYTDNSVRDNPQRAILLGDEVTVISKYGSHHVFKYSFRLADYLKKDPWCANQAYTKWMFVRNHVRKAVGARFVDEIAFYSRIVDAQVRAINKVVKYAG